MSYDSPLLTFDEIPAFAGEALAPSNGSGNLRPETGGRSPLTFPCIVADPPWNVKRGAPQGRPTGVQMASEPLPYQTMSVEEICALKVPSADDAHLYIWTINKYIEATYRVARAWGFEPSTMLYWFKEPKGIGLGGTYALCVEPILFCRRGRLAAKKRCDRNWWTWPRGLHSQKPEAFQTTIQEHSPGPYLEMFARRKRDGWYSWGNEIDSDVVINTGAVAPAADSPNAGFCDGANND